MKKIIILIVALSTSCCFDSVESGETVTILSWNVQNLFDGIDDGYEYSNFSVEEGNWSSELYHRRLKLLSRIIKANNPDIVALQEIEGEQILIDFIQKYLDEYDYYASTRDDGPIQIGFLSKYPINNVSIVDPSSDGYMLRSLLEVMFDIDGENLVVINNHWKSKRGGFTENQRLLSAVALKKRLDHSNHRNVVVLGDLNENYNEYQRIHKSYDTALMFRESGDGITITDGKLGEGDLYTVWPDSLFPGSYQYRGEWQTIDHYLLNDKLLNSEGIYFKEFYVDSRSELFNGEYIYRWDKELAQGYSDHLPIVLVLGLPGVKTTLE